MSRPKLCVTVTAATMADLRARRDAAADAADLVELRLDGVADPSAAGALAGRRGPVIVTCRPAWEGGRFDGAEEERRALLAEAHALGAEYVDVEWRAEFGALLASSGGRRLVVSMHDFEGVPADLAARVRAMRGTGAEVVKVAVMARALADTLRLRREAASEAAPTVLVGMGEAGLPTRLLAGRFGSCWTYAGDGVAPGQIPAARMVHEFGFRRIGAQTALYGVLGRPVEHSVSPAMHNAAFRAADLDAVYVPLAAATFDDFVAFAGALGITGVSVTAPYKVAAFDHADECDPLARRVGSVNTLRRRHGRWEACNTDTDGFLAPLAGRIDLAGSRATVLGAGGAARAVVAALVSAGATVTVAARRPAAAAEVAQVAGAAAGAWPPAAGSWDLLVNATSAGTRPRVDESPLPDGPFTGRLVYDLVYNPPATRLLRDAAQAGCDTLGGLDMLVAQAERQFEWWTGIRPSGRAMRDAALGRLDEMSAGNQTV